eukprot:4845314-Pleurochrysis_carterae.AAC.3
MRRAPRRRRHERLERHYHVKQRHAHGAQQRHRAVLEPAVEVAAHLAVRRLVQILEHLRAAARQTCVQGGSR